MTDSRGSGQYHSMIPRWHSGTLVEHRFENGILQATRWVEALVRKPGDRDNPQKLERAKQRWRTSVTLDPDAEFPLVQKSCITRKAARVSHLDRSLSNRYIHLDIIRE